jgi:hypothetical protein
MYYSVEALSVYSAHKNATTLFPAADLTEKNWGDELFSPKFSLFARDVQLLKQCNSVNSRYKIINVGAPELL